LYWPGSVLLQAGRLTKSENLTDNRSIKVRRVKMEMVALMVVLAWFGIVGSWAVDEI